MQLHIEKIILWPKGTERPPREITFRTDKINVITGQSERGKSALLWIVDYCLGSRRCSIPVGIIRNKTQWFGVLLDTGFSKLLLARREPGSQAQTSAMYMDEGLDIEIPEAIAQNCRVADVLERFRQFAGLPTLDFDGGEGRGGFRDRPSFRDMASFNFLPQHIVANPYTLFYKADTHEHQEKIKTIFPLVLGAIDAPSLEWKRDLKETERELERAHQELSTRRASASGWTSQLRTAYDQARELGLLQNAPEPTADWAPGVYMARLEQIARQVNDGILPLVDDGATEEAARQLAALREEEAEIARKIGALRRKLLQVEHLDTSTDQYAEALQLQRDRLEPVSWFAELLREHKDRCPVCGSKDSAAGAAVDRLVQVTEELGRSTAAVGSATRILDRERTDLKAELRAQERRLNEVRRRREQWEGSSIASQERRQTLPEVYRFVGRLEQALVTYREAYNDRDALDRIRSLERRVERLRQALSPRHEEARLKAAISEISDLLAHFAELIGIERAKPAAQLDIQNLTLAFPRESGRNDHLWEIGSGANWMGYHIATYLALHQHLLTLDTSPVPSFLMIDQPSQAFFPDRWPGDPDPDSGEVPIRPGTRSNDIERVRRIFQTLADAFKRTEGRLQLIVVDHADEITWQGISVVHRVERWRDGDALIPDDW